MLKRERFGMFNSPRMWSGCLRRCQHRQPHWPRSPRACATTSATCCTRSPGRDRHPERRVRTVEPMMHGQELLAEAVAAERNPAAQVADRTSTLRITGLRAIWANPIVFVRIETNHGIVGWGDVKAVHPRAAKPLAESLFELLDGENPTRIEHLWQKLYRAHRDMRGGPLMCHT